MNASPPVDVDRARAKIAAELATLFAATGDARFLNAAEILDDRPPTRGNPKRERNHAIRALAARHCAATKGIRAKAGEIEIWARRYAASGWIREQHLSDVPAARRGKPEEYLWRALSTGELFPGEETLRKLLGKESRF
jgi:hypothetical protein